LISQKEEEFEDAMQKIFHSN